MTRSTALSFVGKMCVVGSTFHVIARYDATRRTFHTRNVYNNAEGPIPAQQFASALQEGIIRIFDHRALHDEGGR
jgi:hypothetical protein